MKKNILFVFVIIIALLFAGCDESRQIDKAEIAETITVSKENNEIIYSFFMISGGNEPRSFRIPANNLDKAVMLAKNQYIPNITLSKLDMIAYEKTVGKELLMNDIRFVASKPYFSPLVFITLCDEATVNNISKNKEVAEEIKEHIFLIKNKNPAIKYNSLSIFNSFNNYSDGSFEIPYIYSEKEIKASSEKFFSKK